MNDSLIWNQQNTPFDLADFAPEFTEIEIGRATDEEYELALLHHEQARAREQEEMDALERELEEELLRLFRLSGTTEVEFEQPDPPGWPGL